MGGVEDQVGRQPQYEAFADEFLDHAEHSLFNAYYDRPACLDLLGDVTGKRVLDAACGPAYTRRNSCAAAPASSASITAPE